MNKVRAWHGTDEPVEIVHGRDKRRDRSTLATIHRGWARRGRMNRQVRLFEANKSAAH